MVPDESKPTALGVEPAEEIRSLREQLAAARLALTLSEQTSAARIQSLEDAVMARDEFLTIAGHELRNPMSTVALQVQSLLILSRRSPGKRAAALTPPLERLERQVGHFITRATTLLDVTRVLAGKVVLDVETVDLTALVRQVLDGFGPEMRLAGNQLVTKLEDHVTGDWDRLRIEQIVTNLVSNGMKYGSGKPLIVGVEVDGANAIFKVADQGVGISAADQARIFQRFERVVNRKQQGGFGVGLWIVRQIVEAMRGNISVSSSLGKGSTFVVTLPRHHDGRGNP